MLKRCMNMEDTPPKEEVDNWILYYKKSNYKKKLVMQCINMAKQIIKGDEFYICINKDEWIKYIKEEADLGHPKAFFFFFFSLNLLKF